MELSDIVQWWRSWVMIVRRQSSLLYPGGDAFDGRLALGLLRAYGQDQPTCCHSLEILST